MSTEDRLQAEFEGFVNAGKESGIVGQLYAIQPYMTPRQQRMHLVMVHVAHKYQSPVLASVVEEYLRLQRENRPLSINFSKQLMNLSLYEYFHEMARAPISPAPVQRGSGK